MSLLDGILRQMDGKAVAKAVGIGHDEARESCPIQAVIDQASIETLDDLKHFVVGLFQNQYKRAVLKGPDAADLPEYLVWPVARDVIERHYAGGLRGALRATRHGVDGGIRGLAELLYLHWKTEHEKAYRRFILDQSVDPTDWDARVRVAREFLRSLSCVVPKEQQIRAEELAPRLEEVIEKHIERTSFSRRSSGR